MYRLIVTQLLIATLASLARQGLAEALAPPLGPVPPAAPPAANPEIPA